MAKGDIFASASRVSGHRFDPEDLVLVEDILHPLYDPRVSLPVSEGLVGSMMLVGWIGSVVVTKEPGSDEPLVVDGRQRVKAAREAAKRMKAAGLPPLKVTAVYREWGAAKTGPGSMAAIGVAANEHAQAPGILERAEKAQRLQDAFGYSDEDVCKVFGISASTRRNWKALLAAPAKLRDAVAAGKVSVAAAYRLASLPEAELDAAIASERPVTVREATARVNGKPARPGAKLLKDYAAKLPARGDTMLAGWGSCLRWVLGEDSEIPARVREVVGE